MNAGDNGMSNVPYQLWSACSTWLDIEPSLAQLSGPDRVRSMIQFDEVVFLLGKYEPLLQPLVATSDTLLQWSADDAAWSSPQAVAYRPWISDGCREFSWDQGAGPARFHSPPPMV